MKKKTLQKFSRLFASLVLVGAMSLGTVATANAAGAKEWPEDGDPKAAFTVEYKRAEGVEIPATDFTVTFTRAGFKQAEGNELVKTNVVIGKMPAISDITVNFAENDAEVKKQSDNFLGEFKTALLNSPEKTMGAGIYLYNVAQKAPENVTLNNTQDELKASSDKYLVKIYVAQKSTGGLYIKGLVVNKGTVDSQDTQNKVDATPGTGGNTSAMVFTNEYIAKNGSGGTDKPDPADKNTYGLKVEKVVSGNNASNTQEFEYSMTITKPADLSLTDTKYTFYKVAANGTVADVAETGDYNTPKTFRLTAKESILVKSCYAGSKLEITEKGAANWTPQVDATLGKFAYAQKTGAMGSDLAFVSEAAHPIGQSDNTVTYTNTFLDNPVTGIIVNNFPFVMMIVMAMAAFAAIVVVKSRRRMNER